MAGTGFDVYGCGGGDDLCHAGPGWQFPGVPPRKAFAACMAVRPYLGTERTCQLWGTFAAGDRGARRMAHQAGYQHCGGVVGDGATTRRQGLDFSARSFRWFVSDRRPTWAFSRNLACICLGRGIRPAQIVAERTQPFEMAGMAGVSKGLVAARNHGYRLARDSGRSGSVRPRNHRVVLGLQPLWRRYRNWPSRDSCLPRLCVIHDRGVARESGRDRSHLHVGWAWIRLERRRGWRARGVTARIEHHKQWIAYPVRRRVDAGTRRATHQRFVMTPCPVARWRTPTPCRLANSWAAWVAPGHVANP